MSTKRIITPQSGAAYWQLHQTLDSILLQGTMGKLENSGDGTVGLYDGQQVTLKRLVFRQYQFINVTRLENGDWQVNKAYDKTGYDLQPTDDWEDLEPADQDKVIADLSFRLNGLSGATRHEAVERIDIIWEYANLPEPKADLPEGMEIYAAGGVLVIKLLEHPDVPSQGTLGEATLALEKASDQQVWFSRFHNCDETALLHTVYRVFASSYSAHQGS